MLESVKFIHSLEIFHRDIKLENFVLDKNYQLKLIDFGFSTDTNAKFKGFIGTPYYAPP